MSAVSGKLAHRFQRGIDFRFAVVDLARLANPQLIPLRAGSDPSCLPKFFFQLGRGNALDAVNHGGIGQFGMHRGADSRTRDLLQPGAKAIGEESDSPLHPFRPQAKVEVQRRIEAGQKLRIAGAILHEPVHTVLAIVPGETA